MAAFLRRHPAGPPVKVIMKRLSILLAIAATLSACGGGGGGAGSTAPATVVDNRPVVDIVPTAGDFYSYNKTVAFPVGSRYESSNGSGLSTDTVSKVDNDGAWTDITSSDNPFIESESNHYLADGGLQGNKSSPCESTYTPALYLSPKNLAVGTAWSSASTQLAVRPCTGQSSKKVDGTAVALETITVSAGTFNTVKIVSKYSTKYAAGSLVLDSNTWLDVLTHRVVKQTTLGERIEEDGFKSNYTETLELAGYASAKQGRKKLNIERFAGAWAGAYSGAASGACRGSVTTDGILEANCGAGLFSVNGTIDANGNGTFYLTVDGVKGANFSGAFESPIKIGGVWSVGAASGTWNLVHQ